MELFIKRFDELSTQELYDILKVRTNIFVAEQNCPYSECDDKDQKAIHIYYKDNNEIISYCRILEPGVISEHCAIGRVLCTKRRKGYATILLNEAFKVAKKYYNSDKIYIEAQTYAKSLYEKVGFIQISDEFLEDGIPHIKMIKTL